MADESIAQLISPTILRFIRFKSQSLSRQYGFGFHDCEDLEQSLFLDLLKRTKYFRNDRCGFRTFSQRVVSHHVATIVEARLAACRDYRLSVSLDQLLSEEGHLERAERTPRGSSVIQGGKQSVLTKMNMHLDVQRVISILPPDLRMLSNLLKVCETHEEAIKKAGISRATFYRRFRKIREAFESAGYN